MNILTRHRVQRIHTGAEMDTATLMLTHLHQRNATEPRNETENDHGLRDL